MPYNSESIRVLTLAIIKNDKNQVLVSPGYDEIKQEVFYRLLGGGVEFGETSLEALHREFKEELNVELTNCQLLDVHENIFTFNNKPGHEIIFIYQADFANLDNYKIAEFRILDSNTDNKVIWLDVSTGDGKIIYPNISKWL
jgi:8-oxo-dGTP pyrophosphatase MutT (NUDIX family)